MDHETVEDVIVLHINLLLHDFPGFPDQDFEISLSRLRGTVRWTVIRIRVYCNKS